MHIRDGLVDAKHRAAMGEAIWLYLYLHTQCAQKTGLIRLYNHQEAADRLGLSLRTVKGHLQILKDGGYVTTARRHDHLTIQITRYEWQEGRTRTQREVQNIALHEDTEVQETALHDPKVVQPTALPGEREVQNGVERSAEWRTPSIDTSFYNGDESVVETPGADAPPPSHNDTPELGKEKREVPKRGADLLVVEMREAMGCVQDCAEDAGKKWAAVFRAKLGKGFTPAERSTFIRWFVSSGYWTAAKAYLLSARKLEEEIDGWLIAGKPEHKPDSKTAPTKKVASRPEPRAMGPEEAAAEAKYEAYMAAKKLQEAATATTVSVP